MAPNHVRPRGVGPRARAARTLLRDHPLTQPLAGRSSIGSATSRGSVVLSSVFLLSILAGPTSGATITNILTGRWAHFYLAINVGDTVVWVNQQQDPPTTSVESYGGEWKSPTLNYGDSFSYTFTNTGFYAYRTYLPWQVTGAVTVNAWTNAPPAVTINVPVDGSLLSPSSHLVQASVTSADAVAEIEYFANTNLIGVATNPPYAVQWTSAPLGQYVLVAKAVDLQGATVSSQPVNVVVGPYLTVWGARVVAGGRFFLCYNAYLAKDYIISSADLHNWGMAANAIGSGAFADEALPVSTTPQQFYKVVHVP